MTYMAAFWNEEPRLEKLLWHMDKYFTDWRVAIQKSDDNSLAIAKRFEHTPSRIIVDDKHRGVGEASFPLLINTIWTKWVFVVSGDEWPEDNLLVTLPEAIENAEKQGADGIYIPVRSWIDGYEFTGEKEAHLRLFKTRVGWPATMHSRPMTEKTIFHDVPYSILHERTLDEMMIDYLRYYKMGMGSSQWEAHNKLMIKDACEAIAERKGWEYVKAFPWWTEVKSIAF